MVIRRHARASGWIQTVSSGKDILPGLVESLFNCSVNQEMAFKARAKNQGSISSLVGHFIEQALSFCGG